MKKNHKVLNTFCVVAALFVSPLAYSDIQITVDVSTASNTPEAAVAAGFDEMCPKIEGIVTSDAGLQQLIDICTALDNSSVAQTEQAYRALSARSNTSNNSLATYGPGAMPMSLIGKRLATLRKAAENAQNARLDPDIDGQPIPRSLVAKVFDEPQTGGGASADNNNNGRLSGFVSAMSYRSEQAETQTLASYHGEAAGGVMGLDYRFSDKTFAGIAGRYSKSNVDLHGNAGTLDADDMNLTFYSTYYPGQDWYLEGTVHYGKGKYDLTRRIDFNLSGLSVNETAASSTNGSQFGASFGGGSEWVFKDGAVSQLTAGLYYARSTIDAYTENGTNGVNLEINKQTIDSLQTRIGAQLNKAVGYSWGELIPQLNLTWIHEFMQDGEKIQASFASDPTNTQFAFTTDNKYPDYFTISLGVVAVWPGGFTAFIQTENYMLMDNFSQRIWSIGARMEF
jgi:uncharacterized protein YhjY with autotransporter beta-barrel domain